MQIRSIFFAIGLLAAAVPAFAASTINPNVPATNAPLASAPVRSNFLAAYNDVNNILSKFGSGVAPALPTTRQDWIDTSGSPWVWNIYDGAQWVQIGTLNPLTHVFSPVSSGVTSFNSRTGAVTPQSGDYAVGQVTGAAPIASPTFTGTVTVPNGGVLGTPASLTLTNATGLVPSTGLAATGTPDSTHFLAGDNTWKTVTAGVSSVFGRTGAVVAVTNDYTIGQIGSLGTGVATALGINVGTAGAPVVLNGALGTPSSGILTSATGLPISTGVSGLGAGVASALGSAVSGSGAICLATGSACAPSTGANPTATIGAAAVNGSATTYMRSDGAPALPATLPALSGINLTALNGSNIASGTVAIARLPTGKSVTDGGLGLLENLLPPQTSATASKTFACADVQLETRRSNSGSAMTDTFPASSSACFVNGAQITVNNVDATATDTITAGAGTSFSGGSTDVIEAGRSVRYIYDLAATTWRKTLNSGTSAIFNSVGSNTPGDVVIMNSIYGKVTDSNIASSTLTTASNVQTLTNKSMSGAANTFTLIPSSALTGSINTQTGTTYTALSSDGGKIVSLSNASPVAVTLFSGATAGAGFGSDFDNIGVGLVTTTLASGNFDNGQTNVKNVTGQDLFAWADGTNMHSQLSLPPIATNGILCNTSGHTEYPVGCTGTDITALLAGNLALTNAANNFTGTQSNCVTTLTISTATFTPDGTCNNYKITLVHASCPCTLANPSATPVAGAAGTIEVIQSATGSDTFGTYGSQYSSPGGTATIALSSGANADDWLSYVVKDSTHIILTPAALNVSH